MANLFLSYDRDDSAQARPLAAALEKAGHSVWWDKHIGGGSQFAKEIEQALDKADAVVVLWTNSSVESPWVRDEAGSGRDKGRLVPLSLGGTRPPLGFRQFQSIDLGRWSGRGKAPRLADILDAIERQTKEPGIPAAVRTLPVRRRSGRALNTSAIIGVAVGLFLVSVGLLIGRPWERTSAAVPTLSISTADSSAASRALAQSVSSKLGELDDAGSGKWQLVAGGDAAQRTDLIIQLADASSASQVKATLRLLDGKDSSVLWLRGFDFPRRPTTDIQQQASLTAARAITCAGEGLKPGGGKALRRETLKLYITGCSQTGPDEGTSAGLRQVVKDAPEFKRGWANLLLAESADPSALQDLTSARRRQLQQDIKRARQLDPKMPEIAIAQSQLLPTREYGEVLQLLDEAHANNPESAPVLDYRSSELATVGRLDEAIADAQQATQLDPTSPFALGNYVLALAYSGRIEAAREQLQRAESLWAGTGMLKDIGDRFQLRFGDPKALLNTEDFKKSPPIAQLYYVARANPTPTNIDRFIDALDRLHKRRGVHGEDVAGHAQAYGELHRENGIYDMIAQVAPGEDISMLAGVVFRPALRKFRQDPRFMAVAKRMGLVDYWTKSGHWPDFCFKDPDQPYDCKKEAAKLSAST